MASKIQVQFPHTLSTMSHLTPTAQEHLQEVFTQDIRENSTLGQFNVNVNVRSRSGWVFFSL